MRPKKAFKKMKPNSQGLSGIARDVTSLKVMGGGGANFQNLPTRIDVRIRRVHCEWRQLEAARKGDRNYLPTRANVFFMT